MIAPSDELTGYRRVLWPDWTANGTQQWWKESFDHYRETAKYDGIWLGESAATYDATGRWELIEQIRTSRRTRRREKIDLAAISTRSSILLNTRSVYLRHADL
jgi:hypothetical protein